ncbi:MULTISPECIES: aldolase/citrate lyase family protein [unclassified Devosia]|uniref:HpcH/HpaI aldolase family protein n=1 Tax=unclassified Devosia TaxID=196773 RepID=UPI0015544729|nr:MULTISPECIES: aldolase/citrate lyase family protein [unclassified Devosia]
MSEQRPHFSTFRARLLARERLFGTFVKLPTTQVIEMLGQIGYDFIIIDQEHAPLDRSITDLMIFAARAANLAPIVRIPEFTEANVLSCLDSGAMGIMVPHVASVEKARAIARAAHYTPGSRGFVGLSRASNWGSVGSVQHMELQDSQIAVIPMIEDQDAIDQAGDIAKLEGIDALFVGRGDLTASFRDNPEAALNVADIARRVADAAKDANTPLMMLPTTKPDMEFVTALGATAIVLSSDHGFIRNAATAALKDFSA